MTINLILNKALAPPPKATPWHQDPNDTEALARVYSNNTVPAYEYPAFEIKTNTANEPYLAQNPDHADARFAPFKAQFNQLCDKLIELSSNNASTIDKFREEVLSGYNNTTSSKYAHQDDKTFAEMKLNLEVVLNQIIKNNDKATLKQVMDAISVCEGGAYAELKRLKESFTEPTGLLEFLEKTRGGIIDALAQQHIAKAQRNGTAISTGYLTHVAILFGEVATLSGIPLAASSLKDVHIPKMALEKDEQGNDKQPLNIVFTDNNEARIASDIYKINHLEIQEIPKNFHTLYTADAMIESLLGYFAEKIVLGFNQYQADETALEAKRPALQEKIQDCEQKTKDIEDKQAKRRRGETVLEDEKTLREEKNNLADQKGAAEQEMTAPWTQFISGIGPLMESYGIMDFNAEFIMNCDINDPTVKITLQPAALRRYYLHAFVTQCLSSKGIIEGLNYTNLNEEYSLATDGHKQWIVDASNNSTVVDLNLLIDAITEQGNNSSLLGMLVNNINSREFIKTLIYVIENHPNKPEGIIDKLLERSHELNIQYNEGESKKPNPDYIIEDISDIEWLNGQTVKQLPDAFFKDKARFKLIATILLKNLNHDNGSASAFITNNDRNIKIFANYSEDHLLLAIQCMSQPTEYGEALQFAAEKGWAVATAALIQANANIDMKNKMGVTPLMYAAEYGDTEIAKALIQAKANINMKNKMGQTPLIYAARNGHIEIFMELIKAGASIDIKDNDGFTALMYAARTGYTAIAKALIQANASIDEKNIHGCTALDLSRKHNHFQIEYELVRRGAKSSLRDNQTMSQRFAEYLSAAPSNRTGWMTDEILKEIAYSEYPASSCPNPCAEAFAKILMDKGATTDYAYLKEHRKVHTLAAFFGVPLLCTLANIEPGSDNAMRLYALVQISRITSTGTVSETDRNKINAFTAVYAAEDGKVAGALANALAVSYPRSTVFPPAPIPSDLPEEIMQKLAKIQ